MQRLSDDLIGYMRTVEIAGVDVVHARRHSLAQNRDRTGNIARRAPHSLVAILSGKLHRPITHPIHSQRSTRERKATAEIGFFSHSFSPASLSHSQPLHAAPQSKASLQRICSRSAISPGPVGRHPQPLPGLCA